MIKFNRFWKKQGDSGVEAPGLGTAYFGYVSNATLTDAKAYVSAWLEKYTEAPGAAGLYLHKYGSGYLFEIQERGLGNKAWLPSILATWDLQREAGESQSITLALDRTVQGQRQGERISFVLLPEGTLNAETTPGLAPTGPALISLRSEYSTVVRLLHWLFRGTVLILFVSLGVKAFLPHTLPVTGGKVAPVAIFRLPIAQWPTLMNAVHRGDYVSALRYRDQTWQEQTVSMAPPTNGAQMTKTKPMHPLKPGKPQPKKTIAGRP